MKSLVSVFAILLLVESGFAAEATQNKAKVADDQAMSEQHETDMTRMIRRKIMDDKSLSMNAHNIKIITENNQVVLRGVVENDSERSKVEKIAKSVAKNTSVINNTTIEKK
ncbi:BON domain-containing protein [Bdellovibrio sp. SKB1291214]|uniref:BON domain-containing protein n=1 Tax=Bdellovibrio sp. SKB1291214 TaxID=1732569 RepID=UPI000B519231|nr:BON domain-containing protein [Bdellovibrio sp. SKB1291214]UYL08042.1 BON domain-containing protein [Bdellovibrio sp. SKB1291214]